MPASESLQNVLLGFELDCVFSGGFAVITSRQAFLIPSLGFFADSLDLLLDSCSLPLVCSMSPHFGFLRTAPASWVVEILHLHSQVNALNQVVNRVLPMKLSCFLE